VTAAMRARKTRSRWLLALHEPLIASAGVLSAWLWS
jgi:hypothetical protein